MTRRPKMYRTTFGALAFIVCIGLPTGSTIGAVVPCVVFGPPSCVYYWVWPWCWWDKCDDELKNTEGLDDRYPGGLHHMNWD
jgi:hypothetical protein